jgi:hypothetical protein
MDKRVKVYNTLFCNIKDIALDEENVVEYDDCMIAYSDETDPINNYREIVSYRESLIVDGHFKPTELYIHKFYNYDSITYVQ